MYKNNIADQTINLTNLYDDWNSKKFYQTNFMTYSSTQSSAGINILDYIDEELNTNMRDGGVSFLSAHSGTIENGFPENVVRGRGLGIIKSASVAASVNNRFFAFLINNSIYYNHKYNNTWQGWSAIVKNA